MLIKIIDKEIIALPIGWLLSRSTVCYKSDNNRFFVTIPERKAPAIL
jgi:hypothetical protein